MTNEQRIKEIRILTSKIYYLSLNARGKDSHKDKNTVLEDIRKMAGSIQIQIEHIQNQQLINPVPKPRHDETYQKGRSWLETL